MNQIKHRKCNDLRRPVKLELPGGLSLRIHHWVEGDPPEYQHAHPWSFITFVLWGGYTDRGDGRPDDIVKGPTVRFRDTNWRHAVVDPLPHTWSVILTGFKFKSWRFWMHGREVDRNEWDGRICD